MKAMFSKKTNLNKTFGILCICLFFLTGCIGSEEPTNKEIHSTGQTSNRNNIYSLFKWDNSGISDFEKVSCEEISKGNEYKCYVRFLKKTSKNSSYITMPVLMKLGEPFGKKRQWQMSCLPEKHSLAPTEEEILQAVYNYHSTPFRNNGGFKQEDISDFWVQSCQKRLASCGYKCSVHYSLNKKPMRMIHGKILHGKKTFTNQSHGFLLVKLNGTWIASK